MPFTERVANATTATKAWVGAVLGGVYSALVSLQAALGDDRVTSNEWVALVIAGLVGSGLVGGAVYAVPNKPKV